MANKYHKDIVVADGIHMPYSFEYADAATRLAATGLLPGDVGKFALQQDDGTVWALTDDSPVSWAAVAGGTDLDTKVKVTTDDTTTDYLDSKIAVASGKLEKTVLNPTGDESLELDIGADVFDKTSDTHADTGSLGADDHTQYLNDTRHEARAMGDGIHTTKALEYADQATREAATGFTADDIGKAAQQTDNMSWWILTDNSPVTWSRLDNVSQNLPSFWIFDDGALCLNEAGGFILVYE